MIKPSRRGFLGLIGVGLAAPLIVRAASIMPVKPVYASGGLVTSSDGIALMSMAHPCTAKLAYSLMMTKEQVAAFIFENLDDSDTPFFEYVEPV